MKKIIGIFVLMCVSFSASAKKSEFTFAAFDFYAPIVTDKDSMNAPQHGSIVYDTTDDGFFGLDSEGVWQSLGGSSGSTVTTPSATAPKLVSAKISNAGASDTVSNEFGAWINGNCDDNASAGKSTCTFETGYFSQVPNCSCTGINSGVDPMICIFLSVTTSGFVTQVFNHDATAGVNSPVMITCHGI